MTPPEAPAPGLAGRLYRCLLRLYPRDFRRRFGAGMCHAFLQQLQRARRRGAAAATLFWLRSVAHALLFGLAERVGSGSRGPAGAGGRIGTGPGLVGDLRMALRRLRRSPGFTATTIVTLGLGLGATATIFSVVDAVLLSPLPYPDSDRLVSVRHSAPGADIADIGTSFGAFDFYRQESRLLEEITAYRATTVTLAGDEQPERVAAAIVTASFFDLFVGERLVLGRGIEGPDDQPDAPRVAVISHGYWQRRHGGDPRVLGGTVELGGNAIEIVGVMPRGFDYPSADTDLWLPAQIDSAGLRIGGFSTSAVARLRAGVSTLEAAAELQSLIGRMHERFAGPAHDMIVNRGRLTAQVTSLKERTVGDIEATLWILLGAVGFVLATACANVVNLLLVRDEGRRREVAVRVALGAGRVGILRYHLSEGLMVGLLGGGVGALLTYAGVAALVRLGPAGLPRLHEIAVDGSVLGFAATLSLLSGLLFGLLPVLRRRVPTSTTLRQGGRGQATGAVRPFARSVLIASQVGLATILLVGAGLMVRSFWQLRQVDPGFDPRDVLTFRVSLSGAAYPEASQAVRFQQQVAERLAAIDGVEAVGSTSCLPLAGCWNLNPLYEEGIRFEDGAAPPAVDIRGVSEGIFVALRIPLLAGRFPAAQDPEVPVAEAVVSRSLAELFWPGESALGRRVYPDLPDGQWFTIVGVVGDVRSESLLREPAPTVYLSFLESDGRGPYAYSQSYVVRGGRADVDLAAEARAAVSEVDAAVPLAAVTRLARLLAEARAPTAFTMTLLVIAGTIALVLGAVGVYGVLAYVVGQRSAEIGVRLALGADAAAVRRMVLRQGLTVTVVGLTAGLVVALVLSRAMTAILFGVRHDDPMIYACVAVVLLSIATAASWLPARRAAGLDPVEALHA